MDFLFQNTTKNTTNKFPGDCDENTLFNSSPSVYIKGTVLSEARNCLDLISFISLKKGVEHDTSPDLGLDFLGRCSYRLLVNGLGQILSGSVRQ